MAIDELNATAFKNILGLSETKIVAALERHTAALLTVAEAITLASSKSMGENMTPVLAKKMISEIFTSFVKP